MNAGVKTATVSPSPSTRTVSVFVLLLLILRLMGGMTRTTRFDTLPLAPPGGLSELPPSATGQTGSTTSFESTCLPRSVALEKCYPRRLALR